MLETIGNNIANVNTIGYKTRRTLFEETLAQTLRPGLQPLGNRGGTNALQLGTGTRLASVDAIFTQGALESTGVATDLALEGDGFFVVGAEGARHYTRAGAFRVDALGQLVTASSGLPVMGFRYDPVTKTFASELEALRLPVQSLEPARVTSEIRLQGNFTADSEPRGQILATSALVDLDGETASESTALVSLGSGGTPILQEGDTITISGQVRGQTVETQLQVSGGTTLGDLMSEIASLLQGVEGAEGITVTLDTSGRLLVKTPDALGTSGVVDSLSITARGAEDAARGTFNSMMDLSTIQSARDALEIVQDVLVYDSLGQAHHLEIRIQRVQGELAATWTASLDGDPTKIVQGGSGRILWNPDGSFQSLVYDGGDEASASGILVDFGNGTTSPVTIRLEAGSAGGYEGLTLLDAPTQIMASQDGYASGELVDVKVDTQGILQGFFANGVQRPLAQLAIARFANPTGLIQRGGNLYVASPNSGEPMIGTAGETSGVLVHSGALERSNVDLAEEFTRMILAQRGFQANARILSATDEILSEVINLTR
jgi:flagellar hook protein FlgE